MMKYKIDFCGIYLRVQVFKTITIDLAKEFAKKAVEEAKRQRTNRFLIDVHYVQNVSDAFEQYDFGYQDMKLFGFDRSSKIAILTSSEDDSHDFIRTVVSNAGYKCSLFTEKALALKWLVQE